MKNENVMKILGDQNEFYNKRRQQEQNLKFNLFFSLFIVFTFFAIYFIQKINF